MKKFMQCVLLVALVMVVLGSNASARILEQWVGSESQRLHYLATGSMYVDFGMWCLNNGYIAPVEINFEKPSIVHINSSKGTNDLGTMDITNQIDKANVRFMRDNDISTIGLVVLIEGIPVKLYNNMSLEDADFQIHNLLRPYLATSSDQYCDYMVKLVIQYWKPFVPALNVTH